LKLRCDEPLSNVAFKFNVRHYTKEGVVDFAGGIVVHITAGFSALACVAGPYTRPLFRST
jgi:ammonia channel protein AmtB